MRRGAEGGRRPPVRAAVAGCGRIARLAHLPLLSASPDLELVAVAEADPARRPELPGVRAVAEVGELTDPAFVTAHGLEALFVCLPPAAHAAAASAALEAGLHVYVEKPLAADLEGAGELLAASRRHPEQVAAVGFHSRFEPAVATLRRWLDEGRVGEPRLVRTLFSTARRELPEWKRRRATGGGVLLDLASHHFDLVPHLLGRPAARIEAGPEAGLAQAAGRDRSDEERALVTWELEGGVAAQSAFLFGGADEERWEIHGEAGMAVVDRRRRLPLFVPADHRGANLRRARESAGALAADLAALLRLAEGRGGRRSPWNAYRAAFSAFAAAVRGARDLPLADFADGWRSAALVEAARESARRSRPVVPVGLPNEPPAGPA